MEKDKIEMNFKYNVRYTYDESYSCQESGCDHICRCMEIRNSRVTNVNISGIVDQIYQDIVPNDILSRVRNSKIDQIFDIGDIETIDKYCIHRILTIYRVWDPVNFTVKIKPGYYGDEVDSVEIINFDKLLDVCECVYMLDSTAKKLEYVLGLEYGYSPNIKVVNLIKVYKSNLNNINRSHFDKIGECGYYSDTIYKLPRGIVKRSSMDEFSIVDGYHRISSTKKGHFLAFEIQE